MEIERDAYPERYMIEVDILDMQNTTEDGSWGDMVCKLRINVSDITRNNVVAEIRAALLETGDMHLPVTKG